MTRIAKGGFNVYGRASGILVLDTSFPRIPGGIGNATTFDFPVAYKTVKGALGKNVLKAYPSARH